MYLDDSYFALNTVHNGYELDKVFGLKPHMLSECFDSEVWEYILEERQKGKSVPQILCENGIEMSMISEVGDGYQTFNPFGGKVKEAPMNQYCPEVMEEPGDIYYHGYWVNGKWFAAYREDFLREFQFPEINDRRNLEYLAEIQNTNSVSVHVRRGDYVKLGWELKYDWYQYSVKKFQEIVPGRWDLFVFSDDIFWCRQHQEELGFLQFKKITYIEGNNCGRNYLDMQLMSKCKANLLSNSAFCYLAALLNTERQYYVNPGKWEM